MMHFTGFKSKAALKQAVKERKVFARPHLIETSMFGDEFKPGRKESYSVCMDHPKRTKFARITVDEHGVITGVQ